MVINKEEIKKELEEKQLLKVQKELTSNRRIRLLVLGHLATAIILTFMYGTLENPFQHTLSQVGNAFTVSHRIFFIVWAIYVGFAFFLSIAVLHKLEKYDSKSEITMVFLAWLFFVATAILPSMTKYPVARVLHVITAIIFSLLLIAGTVPLFRWVARENPRLRYTIYAWISVSLGGGIFWFITLGNTGMYEFWMIATYLIFIFYMCMILFEESIVKSAVQIMRDEDDLNLGIEKAFIDFEEKRRYGRKKSQKKETTSD